MIKVDKREVLCVQIYTHTFSSKCDNYLCPISLKAIFHESGEMVQQSRS